MHSVELQNYFKGIVPALTQRKYDNNWVIWWPEISHHEDQSWSLTWSIRGVFRDYVKAAETFRELTR